MGFSFAFEITAGGGSASARCGRLRTPHGDIPTPVFAPVGTQATVKTLTPQELEELGTDLILSNTYHLYLRPGTDLVASFGGLHHFMGWQHPILTDSGGFQIFSLAHRRRVDDDGVTFRSHIDGSDHRFTPESTVQAQEELGADIIMCLDECGDALDRQALEPALNRTHAWAVRCRTAQRRDDQALFGILQGGIFRDLRQQSARFLRQLDFPGYAIGGLSVGETKPQMYAALAVTTPELPVDRPRYLMGVGAPEDILESVALGVDIFDCVLPTRVARNGALLTHHGRLNIRNATYRDDAAPIEPGCTCQACQRFSRAYVRHLFQAGEILGLRLATLHNLHFMMRFMEQIRAAITANTFDQFKEQFLAGYRTSDQKARFAHKGDRKAKQSE